MRPILYVEQHLEKTYCRNQSQRIYLALEELDFSWDERLIRKFDRMWEQGISIFKIAKSFDRDPDEVLVLALDRGRKGMIQKRKGGLFGEME